MISFKSQFSKVGKPKEFTYFPRYYDERKEKLEEMKRRVRQEQENEKEGNRSIREFKFRSAMQERWRGNDYRLAVRRSNIVLIVVVVSLVMLTHLLLNRIEFYQNIWGN